MAIEKVVGIAVLSGKGGVGKSVIALNLALALGKQGVRTLLFDAGGGDLAHLSNTGNAPDEFSDRRIVGLDENVALYVSSVTDSFSILNEDDIEGFLNEIVRASADYRCVVFDSLTGAGPVAFTLAGLSELSLLVTTVDPTAIAGSYLLLKALHKDGLASRSGLLFNQVGSADESASLKTRFDILTQRFLNQQYAEYGFIRDDNNLAESVLEQQPLLMGGRNCPAQADFHHIADKIIHSSTLQFETSIHKSHSS